MSGRSLRQRVSVAYEELPEDDFMFDASPSPQNKKRPSKRQIVSSDDEADQRGGALLKYAKTGVDNTKVDLNSFKFEGSKKAVKDDDDKPSSRRRKSSTTDEDEEDNGSEDGISDSEADSEPAPAKRNTRHRNQNNNEEDQHTKALRPRRRAAAAPVNYKLPSSDTEEGEEASDFDEEPQANSAMYDSSSGEEEDHDDEEEEEEPSTRLRSSRRIASSTRGPKSNIAKGRNVAGHGGSGRLVRRSTRPSKPLKAPISLPVEATRRSSRAGAKTAKNYNERAMDQELLEALVSSDDDNDDEVDDSEVENMPPGGRRKAKASSHRRPTVMYDDDSEEEDSTDGGSDRKNLIPVWDMSEEEDSDEEGDVMEDSDSEVDEAMLSKVERILSSRTHDTTGEHQLFVKFQARSYRAAKWIPKDIVCSYRMQLVRNFETKLRKGELDPYGDLDHGVHADWLTIDRIVSERAKRGFNSDTHQQRLLLVKWKGLGYADATWEEESGLTQPGDVEAIQRYEACIARRQEAEDAKKTKTKTRSGRSTATAAATAYGRSKQTVVKTKAEHGGDKGKGGAAAGNYWDGPLRPAPAATVDDANDDETKAAPTSPPTLKDGETKAALEGDNTIVDEAVDDEIVAPLEEPEKAQEVAGATADTVPTFQNGRQLRDYQKESLKWMISHRYHANHRNEADPTNCILGDEMGLGKTAQSIAVLEWQRQFGGYQVGAFLIIAPLTTLGHWQREVETWTTMDVVVYAGSSQDRSIIQKYDLWAPGKRKERKLKADVILTSFDTLLRDKSLFAEIEWDTVIIDEAHRLKSTGSATRGAVQSMFYQWMLLLTGTPVQNNMRELYGLLNLVNPDVFYDESLFLEEYGDERVGMSPEQVRALQAVLRPILLRRMKEDVETLPEKEEVIIWTELTTEQRMYYKAIYENQIGTLLGGAASKNVPQMRNLAMELRKVCCHPALCQGLEADMAARRAAQNEGTASSDRDLLVSASGKMLLLDKLLPKLRGEGRKVLIFSQFKIMLDVLEDYMTLSGYPVERIDGSTSSRDRQAAIDRYSKEGSDGFVFLLSTRAGGQGITLTAADTCIIYDSDWNPQNDLQAMARCHRIGQEKDVTIYRLVCKNTYEETVFQTSSRKYGLDEAILGTIGNEGGSTSGAGGSGGSGDPEADGKKIADLLKHGAHCLAQMEAANEATEAFAAEDIDQILQGRTEKRQIGSRAGNTFSVATFAVEQNDKGLQGAGDAAAYWSSLLPEAAAAHAAQKAAGNVPIILAPRRRKAVNYNERMKRRRAESESDGEEYKVESNDSETEKTAPKKQAKEKAPKPVKARTWAKIDLTTFFDSLTRLGWNRTSDVQQHSGLLKHPLEECQQVEAALHTLCKQAAALPSAPPRKAENGLAVGMVKALGDALADPSSAAAQHMKILADNTKENEQAKKLYEEQMEAAAKEMAEKGAALLPSAAQRALDSKFTMKLVRVSSKLLSHMQQRQALAALVEEWQAAGVEPVVGINNAAGTSGAGQSESMSNIRLPFFPRKASIALPSWWGKKEDAALLRGCHVIGYEAFRRQIHDVEAILTDARFGFPSRVYKLPDQPVAPAAAGGAGTDSVAMNIDSTAVNDPHAAVPADSFKVQADDPSNGTAGGEMLNADNGIDSSKAKAPVVDAPLEHQQQPQKGDTNADLPLPLHHHPKGGLTSAAWVKFVDAAAKQLKGLLTAISANHIVGGPNSAAAVMMAARAHKMLTTAAGGPTLTKAGSSSSFDSNSLGGGHAAASVLERKPTVTSKDGLHLPAAHNLQQQQQQQPHRLQTEGRPVAPQPKQEQQQQLKQQEAGDCIDLISDSSQEANPACPAAKKVASHHAPLPITTTPAAPKISGPLGDKALNNNNNNDNNGNDEETIDLVGDTNRGKSCDERLAPLTDGTEAAATPGDGLVPPPALNVFDETRGKFTDDGAAKKNEKESAALALRKAAAAGAAAALAGTAGLSSSSGKELKKGGGGGAAGPKHFKQRSLFELKKVTVEKRQAQQEQQQQHPQQGEPSAGEVEVVDVC